MKKEQEKAAVEEYRSNRMHEQDRCRCYGLIKRGGGRMMAPACFVF